MVPRQKESQHADNPDQVLRGRMEVHVLHGDVQLWHQCALQQAMALECGSLLGTVSIPHCGMGHLALLHDR